MGQINSWADTGEKYIYHIECGTYIYVGQSKAKKVGSRLKQGHIEAIFSLGKAGKKYDHPELKQAILKNGLAQTSIRVYKDSDNYGLPPGLIEGFKKEYKVAKTGVDLDDIDAAEILHIMYYQTKTNKKLVNNSMGGQNMSLSYVDSNGKIMSKILTKSTTPQGASQIIFSSETKKSGLTKLLDNFNEAVFDDKKWAEFVDYIKSLKGEKDKVKVDSGKTFSALLQDVVKIFCDNFDINNLNSPYIKSKIDEVTTAWAKGKLYFISDYLERWTRRNEKFSPEQKAIQFNEDAAQGFQEYVSQSIYNKVIGKINDQINEMWKAIGGKRGDRRKISWKSIDLKRFQKDVKTEFSNWKKFEILRIETLLNTGRVNTKIDSPWIKIFNQWLMTNGDPFSEDFKKDIMLNFFRKVYKKVAIKNYYNSRMYITDGVPKVRDAGDKQFVTNKFRSSSDWLSAKMHREFIAAGVGFVENRWNDFYRPLISIVVQERDRWKYDDEYEWYYRNNAIYKYKEEVEDKKGRKKNKRMHAYVAYSFKGKNYMDVMSAKQITIY